MQRTIEGFHQDELGDWIAELSCGHGQHVRHKPPFWHRPWVITPEGRATQIGAELTCVLCDRFELPYGYQPYKRTREFDAISLPQALRHHHATKRGVWGVIRVLEGQLRYVVEAPLAREQLLEPGHDGIVVPEVEHHVAPQGNVRFFVEFHARADRAAAEAQRR